MAFPCMVRSARKDAPNVGDDITVDNTSLSLDISGINETKKRIGCIALLDGAGQLHSQRTIPPQIFPVALTRPATGSFQQLSTQLEALGSTFSSMKKGALRPGRGPLSTPPQPQVLVERDWGHGHLFLPPSSPWLLSYYHHLLLWSFRVRLLAFF